MGRAGKGADFGHNQFTSQGLILEEERRDSERIKVEVPVTFEIGGYMVFQVGCDSFHAIAVQLLLLAVTVT